MSDKQPDRQEEQSQLSVHCDNKQLLVRVSAGVEFEAAITHTEKNGDHQVVVATTEAHLPLLRLCAGQLLKMLATKFGVPLDHLSYFERGIDSAMFQVDTSKIGDAPSRGHWTDEAHVLERQRPVGMPKVEPGIEVAQEPSPDIREQARAELKRARFHRYKP